MSDGSFGHYDLIDRTWLYFHTAAAEVADHLSLSAGKAQRMLREVCATGDISGPSLGDELVAMIGKVEFTEGLEILASEIGDPLALGP